MSTQLGALSDTGHGGSMIRVVSCFAVLAASSAAGVFVGFTEFVSSPELSLFQITYASVFLGLAAFGLPCVLLAGLSPSRGLLLVLSTILTVAAFALTALYGRSDSSTAVFVYGFGPLVGVPLSVLLLAATRSRSRHSRPARAGDE